jgi:hypothetical protein
VNAILWPSSDCGMLIMLLLGLVEIIELWIASVQSKRASSVVVTVVTCCYGFATRCDSN